MQEEIALNSFLLMAYSISRYTFSGTQDRCNSSMPNEHIYDAPEGVVLDNNPINYEVGL